MAKGTARHKSKTQAAASASGKLGPIGLVLLSSFIWGLSGTAAQLLLHKYNFPTLLLVMLRLLISGLTLLIVFRPRFPRKDARGLLLFAVIGLLPSQVFYLMAIYYSNVATATLLQYLFLPMTALYEMSTGKFRLTSLRLLAMAFAVVGTVLLVAGNPLNLKFEITPIGIAAALLSAFAVAYYTITSRNLTDKYGTWAVSAWGFLIGGIVAVPLSFGFGNMFAFSGYLLPVIGLVLFIAFFGTMLAYGFYIKGRTRLTGTEVAIAASTEPIAAAALSYLLLGVVLASFQYIGGLLIILAVVLLGLNSEEAPAEPIAE